MNKYSVKYFSGIHWRWISYSVLAESEKQVIEIVDKQCLPEYRLKHGEQTLVVKLKEADVKFPYLLEIDEY